MPEVVGSGKVTAPTALQTIATIVAASAPAGLYDITIHASVSNAAVADESNMKLVKNGADFVVPIPHGVNGVDVVEVFRREQLDGINPVTVAAVGAGTAAIVYEATIELQPVG